MGSQNKVTVAVQLGGSGVWAACSLSSFQSFVGDDESGASVLDAHHLWWVGGIDPDVFISVGKTIGCQIEN